MLRVDCCYHAIDLNICSTVYWFKYLAILSNWLYKTLLDENWTEMDDDITESAIKRYINNSDMFLISCLNSHSDGTHWCASNVMLNYLFILDGMRVSTSRVRVTPPQNENGVINHCWTQTAYAFLCHPHHTVCVQRIWRYGDAEEINCWIKSLFLFSLHTKSVLVAS